jgi:hypothetical protein
LRRLWVQGWIFCSVSILGERYTHGHVFDFYKNLPENPWELPVLGDGKQPKSYLIYPRLHLGHTLRELGDAALAPPVAQAKEVAA